MTRSFAGGGLAGLVFGVLLAIMIGVVHLRPRRRKILRLRTDGAPLRVELSERRRQ